MRQWIKQLAAGHHDFADRLADRQSQIIPSEDPDYGDLGLAFPPWTGRAREAILRPPKQVIGPSPEILQCGPSWVPHATLCYSTSQQPAAPIIAALGKALPTREVTIDKLSLVVQHGPALSWDWRPVGTVHLGHHDRIEPEPGW